MGKLKLAPPPVETRTTSTIRRDNPLLSAQQISRWVNMSADWVRGHTNGKLYPNLKGIKMGEREDGKDPWRYLEDDVRQSIMQLRQRK